MKRFWILLPIISAALMVWWMAIIASRSALELAAEQWDAREFTGYHAIIRYYDGYQNCSHDLVVENDEIVSVQETGTCTTPFIEGIEHPTIDDLMTYLASEEARLNEMSACVDSAGECCLTHVLISGRYDPIYGYPRSASVGPSPYRSSNPANCPAVNIVWRSVEVTRFTPS
jgi:hypothetical protein